MPEPPRIIPIACPFGTGGTVFVYYIDAPEPALIDMGVAGSPEGTIEPRWRPGHQISDVQWILASTATGTTSAVRRRQGPRPPVGAAGPARGRH